MTPQKLVILIDGIRHEFNAETFELSFNKYEGADIMLIVGTVEGNADAQAEAAFEASGAASGMVSLPVEEHVIAYAHSTGYDPVAGRHNVQIEKVAIGVAKPSLTGITEEVVQHIPFEDNEGILLEARARLGIVFSSPPSQGTDVQHHSVKTRYYDYNKPGCMPTAVTELTAAEALLLKDKKGFISKPPMVVFNKKDRFRIEEEIVTIKEEIQL